jgi:hypothetical protein
VEGGRKRSISKGGKKSELANYALMANIQHSFEPQGYDEAKG